MAVALLMGLVGSIVIPRVSNVLNINLRSNAIEIAGYFQAAYQQAIMRHQRIRIRFNFQTGEYWAEAYQETSDLVPPYDSETDLDEVFMKLREEEGKSDLSEEEALAKEQSMFRKIEDGSLEPLKLGDGVTLWGVYTAQTEGIRREGNAWVEFRPNGFTNKSIVYITNDDKDIYSVILNPLGGQSKVIRGEVRPDEL